jgi:hypothetical protein
VSRESHPEPPSPHDLTCDRCTNFRHGDAGVDSWELDKGDQSLIVTVEGP